MAKAQSDIIFMFSCDGGSSGRALRVASTKTIEENEKGRAEHMAVTFRPFLKKGCELKVMVVETRMED